jgi:hypothetical protein
VSGDRVLGRSWYTPGQFIGRQRELTLNLQPEKAWNAFFGGGREHQSPQGDTSGAESAEDAGPRLPRIAIEQGLQAKGELLFARGSKPAVGQALKGQVEPFAPFQECQRSLANLQAKRGRLEITQRPSRHRPPDTKEW